MNGTEHEGSGKTAVEKAKADLSFLREMRELLEGARTDVVRFQMLERMIDDWIDELESEVNDGLG